MTDLRNRTMALLEWLAARWTPWRMFISLILIHVYAILWISIVFGISRAYSANLAAGIVPRSDWVEVVSPTGGFETVSEAVIQLAFVAPLLGLADAAGRFVFAYLLWVPADVWVLAAQTVPVVMVAVIAWNLIGMSRLALRAVGYIRGETAHG